jgi:predicted nucleotidyltransferase
MVIKYIHNIQVGGGYTYFLVIDKYFLRGENPVINESQIKALIAVIIEYMHPQKIILFGSYARGTPGPSSDVDLLIIKQTMLPRYKRCLGLRRILRGNKIPLDAICYTPDEIAQWQNVTPSFIHSAISEGVVLYG